MSRVAVLWADGSRRMVDTADVVALPTGAIVHPVEGGFYFLPGTHEPTRWNISRGRYAVAVYSKAQEPDVAPPGSCPYCGEAPYHYMTHICDGCTCSYEWETIVPGYPDALVGCTENPTCPVHGGTE